MFAILALSVVHSKHYFFQDKAKNMSKEYRKAAQRYIMSRIIKGSVQLATLQSLCLLAFANFMGKVKSTAEPS
jgi:hypothetical protein